jgi:hypothetical protein
VGQWARHLACLLAIGTLTATPGVLSACAAVCAVMMDHHTAADAPAASARHCADTPRAAAPGQPQAVDAHDRHHGARTHAPPPSGTSVRASDAACCAAEPPAYQVVATGPTRPDARLHAGSAGPSDPESALPAQSRRAGARAAPLPERPAPRALLVLRI